MNKSTIIQISILVAIAILSIIAIVTYNYIYHVEVGKRIYAEETERFIKENSNPVFKINKIILYSSANVVDNSEEGELQDLDVSQFTDIEIYIDNKCKEKELTAENTINELYINDIKITTNSKNKDIRFNYKNPNNCAKYNEISNYDNDCIMFKTIKTNDKNSLTNYDDTVFFTDCSNPISLGFVNKDVLTNCSVNDTGSITFDGSIFKSANMSLEDLETKISFSLNIVNNYNEKFLCKVNIDNFFRDDIMTSKTIYDGYIMKVLNPKDEFVFLKLLNNK